MASKKSSDPLEAAKVGNAADPALEAAAVAAPPDLSVDVVVDASTVDTAPPPPAAVPPPPPAATAPRAGRFTVLEDKRVANGMHMTMLRAGAVVSADFGHNIDNLRAQGVKLALAEE